MQIIVELHVIGTLYDMEALVPQGVGLIQHMDFAVRQYLDDGSLIRVLRPWCKPFPGFYLFQQPARRHGRHWASGAGEGTPAACRRTAVLQRSSLPLA